MKQASNIQELWRYCDPFKDLPAVGEDAEWFVPCDKIRKHRGSIQREVEKTLRNAMGTNLARFGVVGSQGSGKSTELNQVADHLSKDYVIVKIDAQEYFDVYSDTGVHYTDLFRVIAQQVEKHFREVLESKFDEFLLENIADWFMEIIEIDKTEIEAGNKFGFEAKVGSELPFFAQLFATVSGWVRYSDTRKLEVRRRMDSVFGQLCDAVNTLLNQAHERVQQFSKKGLVVIIDDLDKLSFECGSELFINHGRQLLLLNCNLVTTIPSTVLYGGTNQKIEDTFGGESMTVPMIPTHHQDNTPNEDGLDYLENILKKRCYVREVFTSPKLVKEFAYYSGGSIREMFKLVRTACQCADTEKIDETAFQEALKDTRMDFERKLITQPYQLLVDIYNEKTIHVTKDLERSNLFLGTAVVLEYNGDKYWHDVHPIVQLTPEFQKLNLEKKNGSN